jgi:hypothetical protein
MKPTYIFFAARKCKLDMSLKRVSKAIIRGSDNGALLRVLLGFWTSYNCLVKEDKLSETGHPSDVM